MLTIDDKTRSVAMLLSRVLFRAFFVGMGLLVVATIPILFLTDQIYAVHRTMLDIPRPEYNALLFGGLGLAKSLLFILFLSPAIGIRWALKTS
jgi:hypothetical protein